LAVGLDAARCRVCRAVVCRRCRLISERMRHGVIFDLGGVVLNSPFDAIAEFERELGVAPNSVNEVIRAAGHDGAFARLERGDLTVGSFAPAFARDCDRAGMISIDGHQLVLRIWRMHPKASDARRSPSAQD